MGAITKLRVSAQMENKEAERMKQGNENPKGKEELAMHRSRGVALPREGPQQ